MVSCVIPAAGTSSRMEGQWKLMLPLWGRTIIDHTLSTALRCADQVILVVGYEAASMQEYLQTTPFTNEPRLILVVNDEYRTGMYSSIRTGVPAIEHPIWFILPADMPLLRESHILPLIDRFRKEQSIYDVMRPVHQAIPGHPVLFGPGMREMTLSASPCDTMPKILSRVRVGRVEVDDPAYITDIDTMESYRRIAGLQAQENSR